MNLLEFTLRNHLALAAETKDGIAVTRAGGMVADWVVHVCLPSNPSQAASWKKVMHKVLKKVDEMGLKTIAFPAMGTGETEPFNRL